MNKPVIILGAGGHARVIADILSTSGNQVLGFLDDVKPAGKDGVLGVISDAVKYRETAVFVVAVGDNAAREELAQKFSGQLRFARAVHPRAVIAKDVNIGEGSVIMAGAVVNPGARIGAHCIVNTSASVDHDCVVEDFAHISPGARLAGNARLGRGSWLGAGGILINGVAVCGGCIIGAGGVVIHSLEVPGTYVGVPVRRIGAND